MNRRVAFESGRALARPRPAVLLALIFCCGTLHAQSRHTPTIDESLSLKSAGSPMISPDGRYVAYRVTETNWKDNEFVSQIWLVNLATGANFQLTRGKHSPGAAEWSPDGRWLAFVDERESTAIEPLAAEKKEEKKEEKKADAKKPDGAGDKPASHQIWLISPEGGEAWQLTKSRTDVGDFEWSKDSKFIAFAANPPETKASKDRKEKYSDFSVFEKDYDQNQLWLADVSAALQNLLPADAKQLTSDLSLNIDSFAWSPDSKRIAFSATPNPMLAFSGDEDIYLLDLAQNNAVKKIVALPGPDGSPMFSPDGKGLAFATALGRPYYYYTNAHIARVDLDTVLAKPATAASDVRDLTAKFDEDARPVDWGPGGIYFEALHRTNAHAFRLDPQSLQIRRITAPDAFFLEGVSFTKDFKTMAFTADDATHLSELYVSPVARFSPRKLTDMTAQVKDWNLGSTELVSWKSKDGAEIEGVLHKPSDYDASKKYPLLVMIHGGPTGVSQPTLTASAYAYPVPIFLAQGALVLQPNYRGSAGYGAAFRALNVRNLGVGDMWDVMSGVDSLIAKGIVDPGRMGSMGWSEGGYISAFLTTHTDRFKAISVGAGISDWMTYYVNTDITPFTRQYLHATPWDDPAVYAKTSPITTIKQAKTPTLIQQGSNDKRVPVPDSYELYRGLQDEGVASRLIFYTGFGHGVNKPKSRRALLQSNLDWFNHYIWGQAFPKDSPLFGSSETTPAK
ncbi:MAG TPA: S9 family peptidase [Candidatus Acidoferrales bacterium]|nr:S9 family peptidase [Candidatus Acidoferrales bacterium]